MKNDREGNVELLRRLVGADDATVPQVWKARVAATPDRTFLIAGQTRWTYREAWQHIGEWASFLLRRGFGGRGKRVASFLSNHPRTLWTWFGTVSAGAVYLAVNREHRGPILADMLKRSGAGVLVTESTAAPILADLEGLTFDLIVFIDMVPAGAEALAPVVMDYEAAVTGAAVALPAELSPYDPAGILYTSGTTGRSKAAVLPHNAYCRGAARVAQAWGWTQDDIFHAWLPLFHIAGQMHQTMSMVVVGGAIAQFPTFSRSRFWDQVQQSSATIVCGLANVLHLWWQTPARPEDANTTLRSVISAAVPRDLHRGLEQRFGLRIMEQYGMTEAELLTLPCGPDEIMPAGSCGRAGPDFDLAVVDSDDRCLEPGMVGEIVARPRVPGLIMLGYDGDAEATVQTFRNLWFHTGDFGYLDEQGYLYYVDRLQHVIRRRSENISSYELEQTLARCPAVAECSAIGVPSPLGEQDVKVVVVLREPRTTTAQDIYDFCVAHMARFMVPRYIEIVTALPRNHVGKVEKTKLRELPGTTVWDAEAEVAKRS